MAWVAVRNISGLEGEHSLPGLHLAYLVDMVRRKPLRMAYSRVEVGVRSTLVLPCCNTAEEPPKLSGPQGSYIHRNGEQGSWDS